MDDPTPKPFESALREALSRFDAIEGHPDGEQLALYAGGALAEPAADEVRDHLSRCRHCADLLLELRHFAAGPQERGDHRGAGVTDLTAEADWRRLRTALAGEGAPVLPASRRRRSWAAALAALLCLATLVLGVWVAVLRADLDRLRRPQVNVPIVNLQPEGYTRGDEEPVVDVGAGERFVLLVNPPSFPDAVEHRLEIVDAGGETVWAGDGLLPTEAGNFHLEVSRTLLPPGDYTLRLEGGGTTAEFELRVRE